MPTQTPNQTQQAPGLQLPQQNPLATDMWIMGGGDILLAMDEQFWQGFWQEWQVAPT
jgi:hypothetical protein